ncbi:MAG TPA: hypothetical protein VGM32_18060, partial [Rhodopila sp.]
MPGFWGADSYDPLTTSIGGTNLADYVINHQFASAPRDEIVWWGRYFDQGLDQSVHWQGDSEANALSNAVKAYGNPSKGSSWILPIASAYGGAINGSYSDGINGGNYVGGVIRNSLSSRLHLPGNGVLYVYLDIEYGAATNVNFLNGWANAVNNYPIGGALPLYACVYINPYDSTNVSLVNQTGLAYFEAWGTEPNSRSCSPDCNSPGPTWDVQGVNGLATNVWQYSDAGACNSYGCGFGYFYVDFDLT